MGVCTSFWYEILKRVSPLVAVWLLFDDVQ